MDNHRSELSLNNMIPIEDAPLASIHTVTQYRFARGIPSHGPEGDEFARYMAETEEDKWNAWVATTITRQL